MGGPQDIVKGARTPFAPPVAIGCGAPPAAGASRPEPAGSRDGARADRRRVDWIALGLMGWTLAGMIPRFALDPGGKTPHDAVISYKELHPAGAS
jgi:hypothetical protein